jgi:hypothetical protein
VNLGAFWPESPKKAANAQKFALAITFLPCRMSATAGASAGGGVSRVGFDRKRSASLKALESVNSKGLTMKKFVLPAFVAAAVVTAAPALAADLKPVYKAAPAPVAVNPFDVAVGAAVMTDYNFRGISIRPRRVRIFLLRGALQADFEYRVVRWRGRLQREAGDGSHR